MAGQQNNECLIGSLLQHSTLGDPQTHTTARAALACYRVVLAVPDDMGRYFRSCPISFSAASVRKWLGLPKSSSVGWSLCGCPDGE